MLQIENLTIKLKDQDKTILENVSFSFQEGLVYYISGKNGSGKSTLVSGIMGDPKFETSGEIKVDDADIMDLSPDERSKLGLFLANQHPIEIPGVPLMQYLRLIYNVKRPKDQQLPVFQFRELLHEKAEIINYPKELLSRNLNEGFSGGEKKKTEILQMLILEPKYALLDEVDSGLDKDSIKDVFTGLSNYKSQKPNTTFIIISHYDKVKEYMQPDIEIDMKELK